MGRNNIRLATLVGVTLALAFPAFAADTATAVLKDPDGDGVVNAAEQEAYLSKRVPELLSNLQLEAGAGYDVMPVLSGWIHRHRYDPPGGMLG